MERTKMKRNEMKWNELKAARLTNLLCARR